MRRSVFGLRGFGKLCEDFLCDFERLLRRDIVPRFERVSTAVDRMISRLVKVVARVVYMPEMVRPCCFIFSSRPSLSHPIRLSAILHVGAVERDHQLRGKRCVLKAPRPASLAYWFTRLVPFFSRGRDDSRWKFFFMRYRTFCSEQLILWELWIAYGGLQVPRPHQPFLPWCVAAETWWVNEQAQGE
jgi:hypothetical protein